MTILNENNCLILIIDIQEKLLNAAYNKGFLEKKAYTIAKASNILNIPTIVTEQYPKGLGSTIENIKSALNINTQYYEKTSFSAYSDAIIKDAIIKTGKKQIIIFGIETHICVAQTAAALVNENYEVTFIKDASGSRTKEEHDAGIERMRENGVHIATTEIALFEWLKSSRHEKFKEIQTLIK